MKFFLTISKSPPAQQQPVNSCSGNWVKSGSITINDRVVPAGSGCFSHAGQTITPASGDTSWLQFSLSNSHPQHPFIACEPIQLENTQVLVRLDQVCFPTDAVAWRHTHPGPGFRYLIAGTLNVETDSHTNVVTQDEWWFEAEESPVKATATQAASFIRMMVLPIYYADKPTINILCPKDQTKQMQQTNTRFVDQIVDLTHF